ncbi:MAG: PP2C family serine/threonine-protein phosphatase [Mycobacterium sp.]
MTQTPVAPHEHAEWLVCGASVTGSLHEQRGLGCDDAYGYGVVGDFVVAAVADGAGSVTGTSAWGSYAACQSILLNAMQPRFIHDFHTAPGEYAETLMRWLFDCAVQRVADQAEAMRVEVSRLSTTLCVALAHREAAFFGQVGDGVIATEHDDRIETVLIEPKDDYANTTWFIQSDAAFEESYRTVMQKGVTAFALSTDGMSYKITNVATGEAYEPFFRGSWQQVRSGASADNFAALLRGIEDDQTGDDKTMVLAALPQPGESSGLMRPVVSCSAAPGEAAVAAGQPSEPETDPLQAGSRRRRRWMRARKPK